MIVSRVRYGQDIAAALCSASAVIVENFPTDSNLPLLEVATGLGQSSRDGITSASVRPEDQFIHLVSDRGDPAIDPLGNPMLSTTNSRMMLHTDEHFSACPARYVILLCVRQSENGGDTLLSDIRDIVLKLEETVIQLLLSRAFPSAIGPIPILQMEREAWSVRFNLLEMERASGGRLQFNLHEAEAVRQLACTALAESIRIKLLPGDCLILRNDIVLHGREGFPAGSPRLLKRIRVK